MTPSVPSDASRLVAQLLAEALREAQGQAGVLVRDVPHLDAAAVLPEVAKLLDQDLDLRIAYLAPEAVAVATASGIPDDIFSVDVEQAERWRNTRSLDALIVVVAESDAAKLTSMEDFVAVDPAQLRRFLVERAASNAASPTRCSRVGGRSSGPTSKSRSPTSSTTTWHWRRSRVPSCATGPLSR